MNIFSGAGGLGSALTNPTELARRKKKLAQSFPVTLDGHKYSDAEAAYQSLKTGQARKDDILMVEIIAAKFDQHPFLLELVDKSGGVHFIMGCTHFTGAKSAAFKSWEGTGLSSRFIRNLVAAYVLVRKPT